MPTYVAFLRAVNVRPRWVPMQRLRQVLSEDGFRDVETHIQSGNVRLTSPMRSAAKVERRLHGLLSAEFGFDIPAIVRTPEQLRALARAVDAMPSPLSQQARVYVAFCREDPAPSGVASLAAWDADAERAEAVGRDVVLWFDLPSHEARLTNARLERLTKTPTTTRDVKVLRALAEKWGA